MEIFTYILTVAAAVSLIGAGILLCFRKQPPTAPTIATVLSVGFVALLLLHISKFKHVNGYGFEAETWDEKQVEAAKLVDQLSSISEGLSQQVALLASRMAGFWGPGLTNPELAALLRQTDTQLKATTTIPPTKRDEILAPIRLRISTNYWNAARNLVIKAYQNKGNELQQELSHVRQQHTSEAVVQNQLEILSGEVTNLDALPVPQTPFDLKAIIDDVQKSKVLTPLPEAVSTQLNALNDDLRFFNANNNTAARDQCRGVVSIAAFGPDGELRGSGTVIRSPNLTARARAEPHPW